MAGRFRFFTKRIALLLSFALAACYLLSCLAPYLRPEKWWLITIFGLSFPYFCLLLFSVACCWLLVRRKWGLVFMLILLVGYANIRRVFAFHLLTSFEQVKDKKDLRIVTWNVARFIEIRKNWNKGSQTRIHMMELLKEQQADIFCLQEFHTSTRSGFYENIGFVEREMDYPYHFFAFVEDGPQQYYGSIIFSKYPFIDSSSTRFPKPAIPESLLYVDIKRGEDTLRIYTTHLQSVQFKKQDFDNIERIKSPDDSLLAHSKPIVAKLRQGIIYRSYQADLVRDELDKSPYPYVICGDFNDTPNSYTYKTVRGNLQDAFLKNGRGIGRSFTSLAPSLRIDYILATPTIDIRQYKRVIKPYSDHYMLVADIRLKK